MQKHGELVLTEAEGQEGDFSLTVQSFSMR